MKFGGKERMKQMKKTLAATIAALFCISIATALPWRPDCTYVEGPDTAFDLWTESYDPSLPDMQEGQQAYCLVEPGTVFIKQQVYHNFLGQPWTRSNADLYTNQFPLFTEQGNLKRENTRIVFDYYFPSYTMPDSSQVCIPNSVRASGQYNSPQLVLVANHQGGFSDETDFNSALVALNGGITCDQWVHADIHIDNFENEYGSSFNGRSKTIGTFGFEMKNVYIKNVGIISDSQSLSIW